jgi:Domain of unknown function (DUF4331)
MKIRRLFVASALVVTGGLFYLSPSHAFDHQDAPYAIEDNAADITDVYAFMRPEPNGDGGFFPSDHVVLILNFAPGAKIGQAFPLGVQYEFEAEFFTLGVDGAGLDPLKGRFAFLATCEFTAAVEKTKTPQRILCDVHGTDVSADVETLDAGPPDQEIRVFAGVRSDPAFADVPAFMQVVGDGGLQALSGATSNTFQGRNVMSIVLEVNIKNIYGGGVTTDSGSDGGDAGGNDASTPLPLLAVAGVTSRVFFPSDAGPDGGTGSKDGGGGR